MLEKVIETKICKHCETKFEITDKDLEFYEKVSPIFAGKKYNIPTPKLCPDCRQQRRLSFRNERKLYKRKCDFSGKYIISIYSPDKKYKVYDQEIWWSDKWDALDYGKDFDFSKSFFEQFEDLMKEVPKCSIINKNSENAEFTNISAFNKDSYLLIESSNNEKCFYGYWLQKCSNCVDSSFLNSCESCSNTIDSEDSFKLFFSRNCVNCKDSYYLVDCIGCQNCFGCSNLIGSKYCIKNKQYSKEEYFEIVKNLSNYSNKNLDFHKYMNGNGNENISGDYISNSNNCFNCYDIHGAYNCKNSVHVWFESGDCQDVDTVGYNSYLIYESINTALDSSNDIFCNRCWTCSFMIYSDNCDNSSNCFGCIGLRNKSYCILNKQYIKEEYEILVPKIIEHMMTPLSKEGEKTIEWGEFFPSSISPFGYNETVAIEYFPISRDVAMQHLYKWSDYEPPFPKVEKIIKAQMLPENIADIPDDILNWAIECEVSGTRGCNPLFRITKQELDFYRKHNLPIPRRHPDQRHLDRMALRNPRKLFDRKCDKCGVYMKTTYSPERPEIVYCESCYNKEIY